MTESTIKGILAADHRRCDDLYSELESAAGTGSLTEVRKLWPDFARAMERHLRIEEEILFPAFEEVTGAHGHGPTHVMRSEHERMRKRMAVMAARIDAGDAQGFIDEGDTLLMLIQQHNVKEENMLYPMADQVLRGRVETLCASLETAP